MGEVRVRFHTAIFGRAVGEEATLVHSALVDSCIAQGRLSVLEEYDQGDEPDDAEQRLAALEAAVDGRVVLGEVGEGPDGVELEPLPPVEETGGVEQVAEPVRRKRGEG